MTEAIGKGQRKSVYYALCALAVVVAMFPVSCNYIMSGGIVAEWIARVEELAGGLQEGQLYLFPRAETIVSTEIRVNGMNSNLWFVLPGVLYRLTGSIVLAYRIYMAAVQAGTLFAAMLFFGRVFEGEETRLPALLGVYLYMTCPYRIYICYDFANLSQATAWMLLPLYLWAVVGIMDSGGKWEARDAAAAAASLAGVGYADAVFFVILAGMTLLLGLALRKPGAFVSVLAGVVFFWPGAHRLLQYLFLGGFPELGMPLKSIMPSGYRVGEYFSSYFFRDGHPGIGLGMLTGILAGAWLWFVENKKEERVSCKIFAGLAGFFAVLSLRYFPWDLVERLGVWALKFVSLMDTPAFLAGMAFLCLCVPAAAAVNRMSRHENRLMALAIPVMVLLACVGICVYQCNMLTYGRLPMTFE